MCVCTTQWNSGEWVKIITLRDKGLLDNTVGDFLCIEDGDTLPTSCMVILVNDTSV